MTELSDDLVRAYRLTDYRVCEGGTEFVLHVDEYSPALRTFLKERGATSAAFLTGWNPLSQPLPQADNDRAHEALRLRAGVLGLEWVEALGADPTGQWPPERSLLIVGAGLETARPLAADSDQNAFVWIGGDAVPRLILMR